MYQGHVGADGFMALPTTFFCYFGATFVCWLIIWRLCNKVHTRYFTLCVTTAVMCCLLPIQAMNDIFAEQQKKDFQRLTNIESLFSTDLFNRLEEKQFLSTDIFVVRNALAIHDSYWTEYADINDSSVEILKRTPTTKDRRIYFDDNKFTLWCGNEVCIITNELKEDCEIIQYSENEFMIAKYQNPVCDQGLYEYYYTLSNTGKLISSNRDNFLIESAGSSLKDCIKVNGFYEDGWIGPKSQFIIKTGNEGIVEIEIYCPLDDFSDKEITVYVDGAFAETVKIQEIRQKFSVCAAPYQTIELKLESNFVQKSTSLDIRELATIIMSMEGK